MGKLPIYQALGVPEVWIGKKGAITIHELKDGEYRQRVGSRILPDLDVDQLLSFVDPKDQTAASRRYFDALQG